MLALPVVVQAQTVSPSYWGGSLSYSYRLLSRAGSGADTQGHLTTLNLNGSSYVYRPWLSTFSTSLNLSYDNSEFSDVNRENGLITGRLNLTALPQSRFPLEVQYVRNDSRVQTEILDPGGDVFTNEFDYHLTRLFLRQSYIATGNLRFNATFDTTDAESDTGGQYQRDIAGFHVGFRGGNHNLRTNFTTQDTKRSDSGIAEDNVIMHLDHQYYPSNEFVVTSLVSDVEVDRDTGVSGPGLVNNVNHQTQLFTNFYYRPQTRPFIANGGVRVATIRNEIGGQELSDNGTATISLNGTYQYSLRVHFTGALSMYGSEVNNEQNRAGSDQRLGVVYRSDTYGLGSFIYNYFADTTVNNSFVDDKTENENYNSQFLSSSAGHTLLRYWPLTSGRISFNVNQRISERALFTGEVPETEDTFEDIQGLSHSMSLSWQNFGEGISHMLQFTASDVRDFEEEGTRSDLYNLQWSTAQALSRTSSINGNITAQSHHQVVLGQGQGTVTTISGVGTYQQNRLFRVSQLQFLSRLNLVEPDDDYANRGTEVYWDNQLNYDIGKLRSSLIVRTTGRDGEYFNSLFIRMTRSF